MLANAGGGGVHDNRDMPLVGGHSDDTQRDHHSRSHSNHASHDNYHMVHGSQHVAVVDRVDPSTMSPRGSQEVGAQGMGV